MAGFKFNDSQLESENYFKWDGRLIESLNWAMLSPAAKAIFPVIACHCNEQGEAFPGERRIAGLAGLSDKIVRKGIKDLIGFSNFQYKRFLSTRGKMSKKFTIKLPNNSSEKPSNGNKGPFPFHSYILYSGKWRELLPTAKALYPVMRFFGFFDFATYDEHDFDESFDGCDFDEFYPQRKFDYCEADCSVLAQHAGINRRSIKSAIENLKKNSLINYVEESPHILWRVYLQPKKYYKREYLNKKIMDSYKYESKQVSDY